MSCIFFSLSLNAFDKSLSSLAFSTPEVKAILDEKGITRPTREQWEQIKAEVEQIENYLKYQYKDYINADIEGDILEDNDIQNLYDILSDKENLDTEE